MKINPDLSFLVIFIFSWWIMAENTVDLNTSDICARKLTLALKMDSLDFLIPERWRDLGDSGGVQNGGI